MDKPQIILERTTPAKPWWLVQENVTVLHGTTEAHLPEIMTKGLSPCHHSVEEHTKDILKFYLPDTEINDALINQIIEKSSTGLLRLSQASQNAQLFFIPYPAYGAAANYAISNFVDGGEYARNVREALEQTQNRKITPRFSESRPIIIEADIAVAALEDHFSDNSISIAGMHYREAITGEDFRKRAKSATRIVGGLGGEVSTSHAVRTNQIKRIVAAKQDSKGNWIFPEPHALEESAEPLFAQVKERLRSMDSVSAPARPQPPIKGQNPRPA